MTKEQAIALVEAIELLAEANRYHRKLGGYSEGIALGTAGSVIRARENLVYLLQNS